MSKIQRETVKQKMRSIVRCHEGGKTNIFMSYCFFFVFASEEEGGGGGGVDEGEKRKKKKFERHNATDGCLKRHSDN